MTTGVVLHRLAQAHIADLQAALEKGFGVGASQRPIVSAAVYGATAAQLSGMLIEFTKARRVADAKPDELDAAEAVGAFFRHFGR